MDLHEEEPGTYQFVVDRTSDDSGSYMLLNTKTGMVYRYDENRTQWITCIRGLNGQWGSGV